MGEEKNLNTKKAKIYEKFDRNIVYKLLYILNKEELCFWPSCLFKCSSNLFQNQVPQTDNYYKKIISYMNIAIKYDRFRLGSSKIVILRYFMYFLTKPNVSTQGNRKIMFVIFFVQYSAPAALGPNPHFLTQSPKKTGFFIFKFQTPIKT